jgi:demethylspheroidene O-methyltransferase
MVAAVSLHSGARSWRERYFEARDRLLASPRFQRLAAASPLTRRIARRRAQALFDLCAGFVYSQILLTCVRLDLFEILAEGPQSIQALSARLRLPVDAATRLLRAATALGLVASRGADRYGLGVLGAPMVGNEAVAAMVEHHALLYADLHDPVALLRGEGNGTALSQYWAYASDERLPPVQAQRVAAYTRLMSASQPIVAGEILAAYSFRRHRCLLDVGGGDGTFLAAVAAGAPDLRLMLFDLPAVADRARARFAAQRIEVRATAFAGSFLSDRLPPGADVASLIRVLHDHEDDAVLAILRAVHAALPAGGTLLVAEPLAETAGAEAMGDAYFGFYLLAMGRGRPRSANELFSLLAQAGFRSARQIATHIPMQTGLIVATC